MGLIACGQSVLLHRRGRPITQDPTPFQLTLSAHSMALRELCDSISVEHSDLFQFTPWLRQQSITWPATDMDCLSHLDVRTHALALLIPHIVSSTR